MWIFYTALSLLILFTAYFFALPLSKKRPVLIRHGGLIAYYTVLVAGLQPFLSTMPFLIMIATVFFFTLIFKAWFIYGVTEIKISEALSKAASATRTSIENNERSCKIDSSLQIRTHKIVGKINILSFRKGGESKKAKLTVAVFKKFIQNYFI